MPEVDIRELTKPFGPEALETRAGPSGRSFTYVATHAVINRLNRACHYQWDFRITDQHFEGDTLVCRGELTIPGLGTRAQVGVQKIAPNGGEDLLKGAASDCLKKCASLFGVGIQLYGPDVESPDYRPRQQTSRGPVTTPSARFTDSGQPNSRLADSRTTDSRAAYATRPAPPRPAANSGANIEANMDENPFHAQ